MPTLSARIDRFRALSTTGRVPRLDGKGTRSIGVSEMQSLLSLVRHTVWWTLGAVEGADPEVDDDTLSTLEVDARRRGETQEMARKTRDEMIRACRVFANALLNGDQGPARRPVGSPALVPVSRDSVPPGFAPLYDTLAAYVVDGHLQWRAMRGAFRDFARLAVANGCTVPESVIGRAQFDTWADAAGIDTKRRQHLISGWHKAIDVSGRTNLANLRVTLSGQSKGLSGCALVPVSLRRASDIDTLVAIAPKFAAARATYLAATDLAPDTKKSLDRTLSWIAAELLRDGRTLAQVQAMAPLSLLLERVSDGARAEGQVDLADEFMDAPNGGDKQGGATVCVLLHLFRRASQASSNASHLWLERNGERVDGPWFTERAQQEVSAFKQLCKLVYGTKLSASKSAKDRDVWRTAETAFKETLDAMRAHNRLAGAVMGARDKSILDVTWVQLLFVVLPELRRRAYTARSLALRHEQLRGSLSTRRGTTLAIAYEDAVIDYLVIAILLADAMRIANYAGATAGIGRRAHFRPRFRLNGEGVPCGLSSVEVVWRRDDLPRPRLKKRNKADTDATRERKKVLEPGIVDHALLWDYLAHIRPARLVRRGIIPSLAAFDVQTEQFPFFIARVAGPKRKMDDGYWGEDSLSARFGQVLHAACIDILRLNEREALLPEELIPTWADIRAAQQYKETDPARYERLTEWRGIFSAHIVRTLYNTYWYGVRSNPVQAMSTTDDTLDVITADYLRYSARLASRTHLQTPENPNWYNALVDAIMRPARATDNWAAFWAAFIPWQPERALAALTAAKRAA